MGNESLFRKKGLRVPESLCARARKSPVPNLPRRIHLFDCKTNVSTPCEPV